VRGAAETLNRPRLRAALDWLRHEVVSMLAYEVELRRARKRNGR
jgi:hypothetical protein